MNSLQFRIFALNLPQKLTIKSLLLNSKKLEKKMKSYTLNKKKHKKKNKKLKNQLNKQND
jgi:hypothetical protein